MNKVVARYSDGRMVKGRTVDFQAGRDLFHVIEATSLEDWHRTPVAVKDLKALFWVKDWAGDPDHVDTQLLDSPPGPGQKAVSVVFHDGETIVGTTPRFKVSGRGFFLVPADGQSNNTQCYVPLGSARDVETIC